MVKILKRHVPKAAKKILDPAVGEGALLGALSHVQLNGNLTLIDIDQKRLNAIRAINGNLSLIAADFISWSEENKNKEYDLIITNPPFSAKSGKWVSHESKNIPIEVVFFRKCINLLQKGGTLLAIVPDTLINSTRLQNERKRFSSEGAFVYAYQLPERSFCNIEGAFYLLVFKKGMRQGFIKLRSTNGGGEIKISLDDFSRLGYRLDYSFYESSFVLESLISPQSTPLSALCRVGRGPVRNNYKDKENIHSDSFDGAWRSYLEFPQEKLCVGVKRVARDAHLSFGLFPVSLISKSTDCLIFIQPYEVDCFEVLFYLRVLFSNRLGRSFLLKGVGAKFIQVDMLKKLPFFKLHEKYKDEFVEYKRSYVNFDFLSCSRIEEAVYMSVAWGAKVSTINSARSDSGVSELELKGEENRVWLEDVCNILY